MLESLLREMEETGRKNDAEQTDRSKKYLNITRDTGELLGLLVRATHSRRVLEIGTSNGYSTLWLASALPPEGRVVTIEASRDKIDAARTNFSTAGLADRIEILEGDAGSLLQGLSGEFDLIFLDADRSQYPAMLPDLLRLLKNGGLMICDNAISHREELMEFMASFSKEEGFTTALLPVGKGEFLVYKP